MGFVDQREGDALAALKAERAHAAATGRQIETEAAVRYVAELVDGDTDSERTIRWLIALMVLGCDLAIALTVAASATTMRAAA
jgi:hypothetical protein